MPITIQMEVEQAKEVILLCRWRTMQPDLATLFPDAQQAEKLRQLEGIIDSLEKAVFNHSINK